MLKQFLACVNSCLIFSHSVFRKPNLPLVWGICGSRIILSSCLRTCENSYSFLDEVKNSMPYAKTIFDLCKFLFNFFLRRV